MYTKLCAWSRKTSDGCVCWGKDEANIVFHNNQNAQLCGDLPPPSPPITKNQHKVYQSDPRFMELMRHGVPADYEYYITDNGIGVQRYAISTTSTDAFSPPPLSPPPLPPPPPNYGSSTYYACPSGSYMPYAGYSGCWTCGAGSYSGSASTGCYQCGAGSFSGAGSSFCSQCGAGWYSGAGSGGCSQCDAGWYSGVGWSSCSQCGVYQYSAAGSGSCTPCDLCSTGYYAIEGCTPASNTKCAPLWLSSTTMPHVVLVYVYAGCVLHLRHPP